ncbi:hypothetical protein MsAm2_16400 [Methanolapillus ohkumae]|uniref:Uncharacterized protein n=1 Tax=Methanolapillus ohkumae TaxID=3028298 RepID=A0AA96VG18_9EURY|nr:hypothetical protein MsAm2_16400 [Methanosarcinaceae archaeon Am2]
MKPIRNFQPTDFSVGVAILVVIQLVFICLSYLSSSSIFPNILVLITLVSFIFLSIYGLFTFNSFYVHSKELFAYWLKIFFSFSTYFIFIFILFISIDIFLPKIILLIEPGFKSSESTLIDYLCIFLSSIIYLIFFTLIDKIFSKIHTEKSMNKTEKKI